MNYATNTIAVVSVLYLLDRWRKSRRRGDGNRASIDAVSASMLLSEVQPKTHAQCSIVTLLVFDDKIPYESFIERFCENFILSDQESRFRYRLDQSTCSWVRMESSWTPKKNCKRVAEEHNLVSVHNLVSKRLVDSLDLRLPLWELAFIDSYKYDSTGKTVSACILTIHHSLGDGFTLCHQLIRRAVPADSSVTMHQCFPFQAPQGTRSSFSLYKTLILACRVVQSTLKLLLMSPDPAGPFRPASPRTLTDKISVGMAEIPLSVTELKSIAKSADELLHKSHGIQGKLTLNDLVVAAVTMAFRAIAPTQSSDVISAIWVGLNRKSVVERPPNRDDDWGNQNLGVCYLDLPLGTTNPLNVLIECHNRLHAMKGSPEPLVANFLLKFVGSLPYFISWPLRYALMDKISTSVSNLPGPLHPVKFPVAPDGMTGGSEEGVGTIKDVFFLVAPALSFGPYVTIISYSGKMYFSLAVGEKLFSPDKVRELVEKHVPEAFASIKAVIEQGGKD